MPKGLYAITFCDEREQRLVEKRSLWGRFPTRITSGDLTPIALLAGFRTGGLKPTDSS
jgi:hypothetical protein